MIKKLIPFEWKAKLQIWRFGFGTYPNRKISPKSHESKKIFLFLAADYGNLGDVAITYAQHKFLRSNFPEYRIIEIPISDTLEGIGYFQKVIKPSDLVTIVGGGNMGDLYPMIEHFRQLVIKHFRDNPVISFPQTIDFKDTSAGLKALDKAIRVYSKHPKLILLAREEKTYNFYKKLFPKNKSFLVPDIVMTLKPNLLNFNRLGALICLRQDKEKKLNSSQEKNLLNLLHKEFPKMEFRDTHIGGNKITLFKRTKELYAIWNDFKQAEIVITDRLHGMIFSYITRTPAIVFPNNNHKIKSCYHWIKEVDSIKLVENSSEENIAKALKDLRCSESKASNRDLNNHFEVFIEYMKRIA